MSKADPAERVVDRREPDDDPEAALQFALKLGERDVRGRLDQPSRSASYGASHGRRWPL